MKFMNLSKAGDLVSIAVLTVLVVCLMYMFSSGYRLGGSPVQTNISDSSFSGFFDRMTKLGPELRCNPGSADKVDPATGARAVESSYYTGGLLPGGYCDDQEVVKAAMDYRLVGVEPALGD
jgi:hypothetical protein